MAPADPPKPPADPVPPSSPPAGAGAKPSAPGPVEPPGIATSILPQRQEDARRANPPPPSNDR